ncbi:MAG TPA: hypothetical protein VGB22_02140 [candidate division Zixibacteria bacterium]|jgi:FlaA1/EpsC-like NDP-sugar epimerase
MKRQLPLIIIFILGVFMVVQYHVPHESSEFFYEFVALDWPPIIGMFALTLGIISLVRVSINRVRQRQDNWQYSIFTLVALTVIMIAGFLPPYMGPEATSVRWMFDRMIIPVSATMFSLLAFFIASASYRAFRARSVLATILLVAAVIVMLRFFPLGPFGDPIAATAGWILNVPNLAAKRAIIIGVGLGIVSTALKVILGVERSYLGRD